MEGANHAFADRPILKVSRCAKAPAARGKPFAERRAAAWKNCTLRNKTRPEWALFSTCWACTATPCRFDAWMCPAAKPCGLPVLLWRSAYDIDRPTFALPRELGRFKVKADIHCQARRTDSIANDPEQTVCGWAIGPRGPKLVREVTRFQCFDWARTV